MVGLLQSNEPKRTGGYIGLERKERVKEICMDRFEKRLSVEFKTELDMLSQVDHLNLVKLIGYLEAEHEHILVMEYVPNGNLRQHLDGNYGVALDMGTRLDIAIDVAHALTYLHLYADKPIIHRDVKSSNILLTGKFRAKVADFGFSHVGPSTDVGITHVSTQVKGTLGYLDPEYLTTNQLTTKSDVYSFGILLVEIFTGRNPIELKRPSDERVTFRWVYKNFVEGNLIDILDPNIEKTPETLGAMERLAVLSFACSAPSKKDRPSMKKSVEVLWNIRKDYLAKKQANLKLSTTKTASMHCDSFHNTLDSSGHNISTDFSSRTSDAQGSQRHHSSP
ncbi:hypothetical protein CY35_07G008100 [Sphagnum magellanicum]|uniref:Uncharacterized protein n=2 Tax=Sphagnum magellanicum TaxID=128215 RepID=A0ACB8HIM6_9BRYO|nr:hypothetical protein CY35_07G008100 [Sphagnum magellanicum]KAH9556079.1 hypothetical protein CY35_07G008100 [Sphagnum magellanicum]